MGINITVEMPGMDNVIMKLNDMWRRTFNLSEPLRQAGSLMLYSTAQNFTEQGRPDFWAPLAVSTIKRKARQGLNPNILQATGALLGSITFKELSMSLAVGTSIPYGKFHQSSLPRKSKLPRRQFLRFQEQDIEDIKVLISEYITKGI